MARGGQPEPARSLGKALVVSASVLPLVPYVPSFTISQQGADFGGAASEVSDSGRIGPCGRQGPYLQPRLPRLPVRDEYPSQSPLHRGDKRFRMSWRCGPPLLEHLPIAAFYPSGRGLRRCGSRIEPPNGPLSFARSSTRPTWQPVSLIRSAGRIRAKRNFENFRLSEGPTGSPARLGGQPRRLYR